MVHQNVQRIGAHIAVQTERDERRLGRDTLDVTGLSNSGLSMEGMPSFGGPPLMMSLKLTVILEKSVFGHSNIQIAGLAEALLNPTEIKKAEISPAANTGVIDGLMRENEIIAHSSCCDPL